MSGYQYRCIVSGACAPTVTSSTVSLTVNTAPAITTQPINDTVCAGSNSTISLVATGTALTYQWYENAGSGFLPISNGSTFNGVTTATLQILGATLSMSGNRYQCIVSGTCTPNMPSAISRLTVNALPTISNQPQSAFICTGTDTSFNVSATGTNLQYAWYVNVGLGWVLVNNGGVYSGATTNSLHLHAVPINMNTYQYKCVVSGACTPTLTTNVDTLFVNPLPVVSASAAGSLTFCPNDSVVINASFSTNISSFQWKLNGTNIPNATGNYYVANPVGAYSCMVTNIYGCVATSNNVTVQPHYTLPAATISATGPTTFCAGSSVILNANTGSSLAYQWKINGTPITGATSPTYLANTTGAYTVIVTNTNTGCNNNSSSLYVVVNPLPAAAITALGNTSFCNGDSVKLVANSGNLIYQWQINGNNIAGATSISYTANNAGIYTVRVTDTACSNISQSLQVIVNPNPPSTITTSTSFDKICDNSSLLLQANNSAGVSYQWMLTGVNIYGATSSSYSAYTPGNYSVRLTNSYGCSSIGQITITTDTAINPVIYINGSNICTYNYASIQWLFNGTPINGANSQCYNPTQPGNYSVIVSDGLGCYATSASIPAGVSQVSYTSSDVHLYPNPATSVLNIDAPVSVDVLVFNLQGQLTLQVTDAKSIDISNLNNGVYMIQILDKNKNMIKAERLIKNGN